MKVYVIHEWCGEPQGNYGVFSSPEKAKEAIAFLDTSGACRAKWLFVEEYVLDKLGELRYRND